MDHQYIVILGKGSIFDYPRTTGEWDALINPLKHHRRLFIHMINEWETVPQDLKDGVKYVQKKYENTTGYIWNNKPERVFPGTFDNKSDMIVYDFGKRTKNDLIAMGLYMWSEQIDLDKLTIIQNHRFSGMQAKL